MTTVLRSLRGGLAGLFLMISARAALAAPPDASEAPDPPAFGDHTLKGHTFIEPMLQQTAFVTTHFGIRQGILVESVPHTFGNQPYTLSGLTQALDLGIRIQDWIGIFATGTGSVVTGADAQSILDTDNTFSVAGEAGLVLRLARISSTGTQFALRAGGGLGTGRVLDVMGLVEGLAANPEKTFNGVLKGRAASYVFRPQSTSTYAASLYGAQALTPNLSVQLSFEGRRYRAVDSLLDPTTLTRTDQASSATVLTTALAVTVDGAPNGIPVGAVFEYSLVGGRADDDGTWSDLEHTIGAGIYYTGRRNLQLGFGGTTALNLKPQTVEDDEGNKVQTGNPMIVTGQFILRYVW